MSLMSTAWGTSPLLQKHGRYGDSRSHVNNSILRRIKVLNHNPLSQVCEPTLSFLPRVFQNLTRVEI